MGDSGRQGKGQESRREKKTTEWREQKVEENCRLRQRNITYPGTGPGLIREQME